jgi:type IV pilus assembly protein PilM
MRGTFGMGWQVWKVPGFTENRDAPSGCSAAMHSCPHCLIRGQQGCGTRPANASPCMALPFLNNQSKRTDQVVAIDLGGRHTKAVHLQVKHDRVSLLGYTIQDAPTHEKGFNVEVLGGHLKSVFKALGDRTRCAVLAVGVPDAFLRHAELPPMALSDMRQLLRINSKNYLQQDFPDHVFDCSVVLFRPPAAKVEGGKAPAAPNGSQKQKVLVGGTKRQTLEDLKGACKVAGVTGHYVSPGMVGPVNAFEAAEPDLFAKEVLALVDVGYKHSIITMLNKGELSMNRVVAIGGDHLTAGLAESLSISHAEAEGIKVGMAGEVQHNLEPVIASLGRELRASIDFFEHHQDVTVNQVFISGGSVRSEIVLRALQTELMVACRTWNPAQRLQPALSVEQRDGLEQAAPQLAVAIGAGVAAF